MVEIVVVENVGCANQKGEKNEEGKNTMVR